MRLACIARRGLLWSFAGLLVLLASPAPALAADPAVDRVRGFYDTLLGVMQQADSLGFSGRYQRLEPAVDEAFDVPTMTRVAVGQSWGSIDQATRDALTMAFRRLIVSSYASNFDDFMGESFVVDDQVQTRGADRFVQSQMVRPQDKPVSFTYRMRESSSGGGPKIIDIFYQGSVSELTTRRAEFATVLRDQGPQGLVEHINQLADRLRT